MPRKKRERGAHPIAADGYAKKDGASATEFRPEVGDGLPGGVLDSLESVVKIRSQNDRGAAV